MNVNQRIAYGETLASLGETDPDIVVLDADLCRSTMTTLFQQKFPDRFFEMGIAEQNMTSAAAGLALTGKTAFTNSFAVFAAGRAYDQFRQTIAIGNLNVKVCGSSAGLSDFGDGATHQAVEDIAVMSAIPNVSVFVPADGPETERVVRFMARTKGPMYLRVCRGDLPIVTDDNGPEIGQARVLADGTDVAVFACGAMTARALDAARMLKDKGISAKIINVNTIKPLDTAGVLDAANGMKGVVTAEEHSVIGGLGAAVSRALRLTGHRIEYVGICDKFGQSAYGHEELLVRYGLTPEDIANAAERVLDV